MKYLGEKTCKNCIAQWESKVHFYLLKKVSENTVCLRILVCFANSWNTYFAATNFRYFNITKEKYIIGIYLLDKFAETNPIFTNVLHLKLVELCSLVLLREPE